MDGYNILSIIRFIFRFLLLHLLHVNCYFGSIIPIFFGTRYVQDIGCCEAIWNVKCALFGLGIIKREFYAARARLDDFPISWFFTCVLYEY